MTTMAGATMLAVMAAAAQWAEGQSAGGQSAAFPVVPAPDVRPAPPREMIVTWSVQDIRCAGVPVAAVRAPAAMPASSWRSAAVTVPAQRFAFRIDASGRPLGIRRLSMDYADGVDDLAPALAVAQFASGAARSDCSLAFAPTVQPVTQAPVATIIAYTMSARQRPTAAMWARLRPGGSTCSDPAPDIRMRAYPAFAGLPKRAGERSWSMIGFDLNARGRPVRVRRIAGTGNSALDAASVAAVADSRFAAGARSGCTYPYWLAAATLPAPPAPEEAAFRTNAADCPSSATWTTPPSPVYPAAYGRRSIEGWAVVGYDVAPWGEIGNIRVLAAEPTEDFGRQAIATVRSARREASGRKVSGGGLIGCVDRVVFRMPDRGRAPPSRPVPIVDAVS